MQQQLLMQQQQQHVIMQQQQQQQLAQSDVPLCFVTSGAALHATSPPLHPQQLPPPPVSPPGHIQPLSAGNGGETATAGITPEQQQHPISLSTGESAAKFGSWNASAGQVMASSVPSYYDGAGPLTAGAKQVWNGSNRLPNSIHTGNQLAQVRIVITAVQCCNVVCIDHRWTTLCCALMTACSTPYLAA
jgi:hypothetical protein